MTKHTQKQRRVLRGLEEGAVMMVEIAEAGAGPSASGTEAQAQARLVDADGEGQLLEVVCPCGNVVHVVCELEDE